MILLSIGEGDGETHHVFIPTDCRAFGAFRTLEKGETTIQGESERDCELGDDRVHQEKPTPKVNRENGFYCWHCDLCDTDVCLSDNEPLNAELVKRKCFCYNGTNVDSGQVLRVPLEIEKGNIPKSAPLKEKNISKREKEHVKRKRKERGEWREFDN